MSEEYYKAVFRLPEGASYGLKIESGRKDLLTGERLSAPDPSLYEISLLVVQPDGKILAPPSDSNVPFYCRITDNLPKGKSLVDVLLEKAVKARRIVPVTTLIFKDKIVFSERGIQ